MIFYLGNINGGVLVVGIVFLSRLSVIYLHMGLDLYCDGVFPGFLCFTSAGTVGFSMFLQLES